MAAPEILPRALPSAAGKIGRYELVEEIASGGMGRVYLARARGPAGFEKLVALKSIHPELSADQSFVDMFLDEARITARIDHPNVCRVFDFGEAEGRYFIAMEYMVGEPVTRVARKLAAQGADAPRSDEVVAHIIAEAAEGLHAAHELADEYGRPLDIVHRDVSPHNLFVTYDGGVRVVDFGIASARGRLHRTSTGSVKGKLAYMAPEQMRRERADARVDVWALGVVLWELLTRTRLFKGANEIELMLAVMNDPVPPPTSVRPTIDPELEGIVMRALAKDTASRYSTARELSSALNRWVVSHGLVVGMAETGAFMSAMFATERAARFELVDRARRLEVGPPTEPARADEAVEKSVTRETRPETPRLPASGLSRARRRAATAAGGALLVGLASIAWVRFGSGEAAGPEPVEVAPTSSPAPTSAEPTPRSVQPTPAPSDPAPPRGGGELVVTPIVDPVPPASPPPESAEPAPRRGRRPERRSAAPQVTDPAASTGHLHVDTPGGWADVHVDGRRIGRTPLDADLPVGRSVIELRPFGLVPTMGDAAMRRTVTIGERPVQLRIPIES